MKFAIIFYAVFSTIGSVETKEVISWGLTFNHHEQCIAFYNNNKNELIAGVKQHAQKQYDKPLHLTELGCAHAVSNFGEELPKGEERDAMVSLRMPLYTGSSI